jgi:hypothetical protein
MAFEIEQIRADLYSEHIDMRRAIARITKIVDGKSEIPSAQLADYQNQVDRWLIAHARAEAFAHALHHLTNESEEAIYQAAYEYINRERN